MSPNVRVIIQSRISSNRLPAKALLPIAGIPSVLLCALRAANAGHEVVVATSTASDDDCIADLIESHGIRTVRGSLNDVLKRFVDAIQDLDDNDYVIRLTADNMFPDGQMIQALISNLSNPHAARFGFEPGIPFGCGIEVYRAGLLRCAHDNARDSYDREHVGPWINRNVDCETVLWPVAWKQEIADASHVRVTMDSLSDYLRIRKVFDEINDPINVPWYRLTQKMIELFAIPKVLHPATGVHGNAVAGLQLGTAQMGTSYGIANKIGMLSEEQVSEILRVARDFGISEIETARDYGSAETRLGCHIPHGDASRFRITTKLSCLKSLSSSAADSEVKSSVDASIYQSCRELRIQRIPIVFFHRSEHLTGWNRAVLDRLLDLKKDGVVGEVGVSIYDPFELSRVVEAEPIRHVQIPFNVMDHRWLDPEVQKKIELLIARKVSFSVRSTLLQGLLVSPHDYWPIPKEKSECIVKWLIDLTNKCNRESIKDFAFAFVRSFDWVNKVVVGVDSAEQLVENAELFGKPPLSIEQRQYVVESIPVFPNHLIDPRKWGHQ